MTAVPLAPSPKTLPLRVFNRLEPAAATTFLHTCLAVDLWVETLVAGRSYAHVDDLLEAAREAAYPFSAAQLEEAVTGYGGSRLATRLRDGGLPGWRAGGAELRQRLERGEAAYERRFGRPFLVRVAGRSAIELLHQLETRLGHGVEEEDGVLGNQVRQIALLELIHRVTPG